MIDVSLPVDMVLYLKPLEGDERHAHIVYELDGNAPRKILCREDNDTVYLIIDDDDGELLGYEFNDKVFGNLVNLFAYVVSNVTMYV